MAIIAAWRFDNDLTDSSGNGFELTDNGGSSFISGLLNQALELDSTNPLSLGTDFSPVSHDISFSIWVKVSGVLSVQQDLFGQSRNGVGNKQWLYLNSDGTPGFSVTGTAGISGSVALNDGNWHHLVGTYTAATHGVILYVDGISVNSGTQTWSTLANNFLVGNSSGITNIDFDMGLVYSNVISQANITQLYNNGLGFDPTAPLPLVKCILIIPTFANKGTIITFG